MKWKEGGWARAPAWRRCSPTARRAALEEDAYSRIKLVLRWYLSGFYKKPKVRGTCQPGVGELRPSGRATQPVPWYMTRPREQAIPCPA